jgi:hypothetical protein
MPRECLFSRVADSATCLGLSMIDSKLTARLRDRMRPYWSVEGRVIVGVLPFFRRHLEFQPELARCNLFGAGSCAPILSKSALPGQSSNPGKPFMD